MKRLVLAIALTGLMSMTVLAGDVPTNGVVGEVPTNRATATANNNVEHDQHIEQCPCYGDTHRAWSEIDH
jgi:hypothetical protein